MIVPDEPNRLVNPGAESGSISGWTALVGTPTAAASATAHAGSFVFRFDSSERFLQTVAETVVTSVPWHVGAWVRMSTLGTATVTLDLGPTALHVRAVRVDPNDGTMAWLGLALNTLRSVPLSALGYTVDDWTPLFVTGPIAAAAFIALTVETSSGTGVWDIDDLWMSRTSFPIPVGDFHTGHPPEYSRGFHDDIHGTIHRDYEVVRDQYGRLRRADDVDDLDHDDLRILYPPRSEQPTEDP